MRIKTGKAPLIAVLLGATIIVLTRFHTLLEPLDRDLTTYLTVADGLRHGRLLYADLWDHKPPLVHVLYGFAVVAFGYGPYAVFFLNVVFSILTMLAIGASAATRLEYIVVVLSWAVVGGDPMLEANQPNVELFMNFFIALGFALLVRPRAKPATIAAAVLSFALASLLKPVALAVGLAIFACARRRSRALARECLLFMMVPALWLVVYLYFVARGSGDAFVDAVFRYNSYYAGDLAANVRELFSREHALSATHFRAVSLLLFVPVCAIISLAFRGSGGRGYFSWLRGKDTLAAYLGSAYLAVALPGKFFPHYYQLLLPPVIIAAGRAVRAAGRASPVAGVVALWSLCLFVITREAPVYRLSADDWSRLKYEADFLSARDFGDRLKVILGPGETFYEYGDDSGLYFYSGHEPPAGVFYVYPLLRGPLEKNLTERTVHQLEKARPRLLVIKQIYIGDLRSNAQLNAWAERNYDLANPSVDSDGFSAFERRPGK